MSGPAPTISKERMMTSWFRRSNALLASNANRATHFPFALWRWIASSTLPVASWVPLPGRNPKILLGKICSRWFKNCWRTTHSSSFPRLPKRQTGRKFSIRLRGPDLCTGTIFPCFQMSGNMPSEMQRLKTSVIASKASNFSSLIRRFEMESGPKLEEGLIESITFATSSVLQGWMSHFGQSLNFFSNCSKMSSGSGDTLRLLTLFLKCDAKASASACSFGWEALRNEFQSEGLCDFKIFHTPPLVLRTELRVKLRLAFLMDDT